MILMEYVFRSSSSDKTCYTSPIKYSTVIATITTNADIMNPWIIGLIPDFFISPISVFMPIAAREDVIRTLLISFKLADKEAEKRPILFNTDMPTNARINHGNSDVILTLICF